MAENKGLISIVLPIYNVEPFLKACLDSVVSQTYKNLEIICVNDETPDNSVDIVLEYMKKDDRIFLINQKNTGLSGARNAGLAAANGEYVMFLDSDDWIETETCEAAIKEIESENAQLVMWSYVREFPTVSVPKAVFDEERIVFSGDKMTNLLHRRIAGLCGKELSNPENADSAVTAWGKLFKTSILKENNCLFTNTREVGTEDALFNLEAFCYVKKAVFINRYFNHYRKDNVTSLTRKHKPNLFNQWQELYKRMRKIIEENNLDFEQALNNRIALSIIGLGLNELIKKATAAQKIKALKAFLNHPAYKEAYAALEIKYFPLHWKVFFLCCKLGNASALYFLLVCINRIIEK